MKKIKGPEYQLADRAMQNLVKDLCLEFRSEFDPQPRIIVITKDKVSIVGDRMAIAKIRKISSKDNCIHSYRGGESIDFCMEISMDIWPTLTEIQQEAIIVHELFHIVLGIVDKEIKWSLRGHDIEEFAEVVSNYGHYMVDIQDFMKHTENARHILVRPRVLHKKLHAVG